ncbi:MAG: hypothetical protein RBR66_03465 [Candidatus Izemoplasmatales bacterium]|jgi:hypothetical protein|nr:hypothetical protein [Candidatus Izemoplasmatales bacterium]
MLNIELLQKFEDQAAMKQNRKPATVKITTFPKGLENISSMYERNNHEIIMNVDNMNQLNDIELVATIFHEGRHAYQWLQITNPDASKEPKELIDKWEKEFLNYQQSQANHLDKKYLNLNIEIDAVAYASLNIFNITKLSLYIAPEMKEAVLKRQDEIKDRDDMF